MKFTSHVPILRVEDFAAAMAYYTKVLGFEKAWDWGEPPVFGCVCRDDVSIFLSQGDQGQPGTWMSIFVDNVDELYEEYKKSGAKIKQPPTTFEWGMREMNVEDLDGHRLRIGHGTDEKSENTNLIHD